MPRLFVPSHALRPLPFGVLALALASGCVSQKKYDNAMDELVDANVDVLELQARNDHLETELELTDSEVVDLYDSLHAKDQALARARAEAWYLRRMERRLVNELAPMVEAGSVKIERRDRELAVVFTDHVLFDSASDVIHTDGLNKLTEMAGIIRDTPAWDYEVEGHADSRPIRTDEYDSNWDLAAARAVSVVEFLTEHNDVDPTQVKAVSFGDTRPEASNATEAGRQENRRIEIALVPDLDELIDTSTLTDMAEQSDALTTE